MKFTEIKDNDTKCKDCIYLAGNKRWCAAWAMHVVDANREGVVNCSVYSRREGDDGQA